MCLFSNRQTKAGIKRKVNTFRKRNCNKKVDVSSKKIEVDWGVDFLE